MAFAAAAIPIITAVSGAMAAVGTYVQAQERASADRFNADVADRNAMLSRRAAAIESEDKSREHRRTLGRIRANYGANGTGGAGTSLDVLEDATTEAQFDIDKIKYDGELQAIGLTDQAAQYRHSAAATSATAPLGLAAGLLSAGAGGTNDYLRRVA
jgi:hypothetical protein